MSEEILGSCQGKKITKITHDAAGVKIWFEDGAYISMDSWGTCNDNTIDIYHFKDNKCIEHKMIEREQD